MISKIKTKLIKFGLTTADYFGRVSIYNREMPITGLIKRDISYGPHPEQKVDLILPETPTKKPGIIYVHGGGWLIGNKASYTRVCAVWAEAGFPVVNVNYRLAPDHTYPEQLTDIHQAVQLALSLFREHGYDSTQLVLAGDSAGAHLTSWYAAAACSPQLADWAGLPALIPAETIRGLVLFYGVYNLKTALTCGFPFIKTYIPAFTGNNLSEDILFNLSPTKQIKANFPRSFVFALESDALLNESLDFINELKEHNIQHEALILTKKDFPDAHHGFINQYFLPFARMTMPKTVKFLNQLSV